ncbi:hypothetical protein EJB05_03115, partial [Eragrostis curvula]
MDPSCWRRRLALRESRLLILLFGRREHQRRSRGGGAGGGGLHDVRLVTIGSIEESSGMTKLVYRTIPTEDGMSMTEIIIRGDYVRKGLTKFSGLIEGAAKPTNSYPELTPTGGKIAIEFKVRFFFSDSPMHAE